MTSATGDSPQAVPPAQSVPESTPRSDRTDRKTTDPGVVSTGAAPNPGRNLALRIGSTLVGAPFLSFLIFADVFAPQYPALLYVIGGIIFSNIGALEFFVATRQRGYKPMIPIACCAVALLQLYAWQTAPAGLHLILTSLFALLLIAALLQTVLIARESIVVNLGVTLTGVAYTGWLFSYLIRLRTLPETLQTEPFGAPYGAWIAFFVFFVSFSADTAAYFVGRAVGRRPLSPRLSPGKTVEGSIGGLAGGVAMALLIGSAVGFPMLKSAGIGLILAALGQIGDLFASALKRDLQIKDFGGLLPGMGGLLDRFDSILFAAPIAYYIFLVWK